MTTILITAAEPSADRLGAALMTALKTTHPHLQFVGVGGEEMRAAGLTEIFPQSDINVMGFTEVVPHIPTILKRIKELAIWVKANHPAALVTIDAQDFSARLGKKLRAQNPTLPIVQYGSPTVWAWRPGRAKKLAGYLTHLLTLFPFEGKYYAPYNLPATYVGHPAVPVMAAVAAQWGTRRQSAFAKSQPTLALLPGSRPQEWQHHWPVMLATYRQLKTQFPKLKAILVLPNPDAITACQTIAPWQGEGIATAYGEGRFQALASVTAALAKSGTNNLEMALLATPAVVCYRMGGLSHLIASLLIKTKFISLPNIILGEEIYPEFIQGKATAKNLAAALAPLYADETNLTAQTTQLTRLAAALQTPQPPAQMAAAVVNSYIL
jgi:lipid-A-disaccharide synthase